MYAKLFFCRGNNSFFLVKGVGNEFGTKLQVWKYDNGFVLNDWDYIFHERGHM